MRYTFLIVVLLNSFIVGGCKQNTTAETTATETSATETSEVIATSQTDQSNEILVLSWEDLMPEGEEERLTEMYAEFYFGLQKDSYSAAVTQDLEPGEDINFTDTIAEGSAEDSMKQIGTFNVVPELNGKRVRLPGYVVPLDYRADSKHKNFLLVPYFGACLHTPPPPPNQIVSVSAAEPVEISSIYNPVWIEGELITGKYSTDLADSAYELELTKLEPYE